MTEEKDSETRRKSRRFPASSKPIKAQSGNNENGVSEKSEKENGKTKLELELELDIKRTRNGERSNLAILFSKGSKREKKTQFKAIQNFLNLFQVHHIQVIHRNTVL